MHNGIDLLCRVSILWTYFKHRMKILSQSLNSQYKENWTKLLSAGRLIRNGGIKYWKSIQIYSVLCTIHLCIRHRRSIIIWPSDRQISLVSFLFKQASTFLLVWFQSRQDEQNKNGPISRDSCEICPFWSFDRPVLSIMDQEFHEPRRDKMRREWSKYVRPPVPEM